MSKTVELAKHLETLKINNMYKSDFYWTWDKTDDEIDAIFTVADALRDLFTVCETPDPAIRLRKAEKWRQWMMNEGNGRK